MTRRSLLSAPFGLALAAQQDYRTSTQPGAKPDYERPLFHLEKFSTTPVRVKSIDILKKDKDYFVRARSTDGVAGYSRVKEQVSDYLPILERRVIPFFVGKDIRDLETLIDDIYIANYKLAGQPFWAPVASVEQALFDVYGRTVKRSVGELLGGVKRKKIPVYLSGSVRTTTAEQEVEVYRDGIEKTGAKACKFKIGGRMSRNADVYPRRTEDMMTLARKVLGDKMVIYVDANGSYNAARGIEVGRLLQDLNCGFFEEPCPWEEVGEMKRVHDALKIPIAFGEQDSSLWKFQWMVETRALDIVQPDLNYNGGFIRAARVARLADAAKMTIVPHNTQTGASAVNILQFASAIPNIGPYMEYPFRGAPQNEPWFAPHFHIKDGFVEVPSGHGLGIDIDPKYLSSATTVRS